MIARFLVLAALAAAAPAQEPADEARAADADALRERDREALHPDSLNALRLVGMDEEGNGFRHRTPGLLRSRRTVREVDPDDLYARRLAMYEEAAVFHRPAPPVRDVPREAPRRTLAPGREPLEEEGGGPSPLWVVALGVGALAVLVVRRARA